MDLKEYKVPPMFRYCDFAETIMPDGTLLVTTDEPVILNDGNVIFPIDWSDSRRDNFREANGLVSRS
jgi:hypothetical protein